MDENDSVLGSLFAGFALGALIGAVTALILAPQSGEETRRQLADKRLEIRDASQDRYEQVRDTADSYARRAGDAVADTRSRAQHFGDQVQQDTRIVLDPGKDGETQTADQKNDATGDAS